MPRRARACRGRPNYLDPKRSRDLQLMLALVRAVRATVPHRADIHSRGSRPGDDPADNFPYGRPSFTPCAPQGTTAAPSPWWASSMDSITLSPWPRAVRCRCPPRTDVRNAHDQQAGHDHGGDGCHHERLDEHRFGRVGVETDVADDELASEYQDGLHDGRHDRRGLGEAAAAPLLALGSLRGSARVPPPASP